MGLLECIRPFGGVVVDLERTVVGIARQSAPAREGIADCRGRIGLAGELGERCFHPEVQAVEQRFCAGLPN